MNERDAYQLGRAFAEVFASRRRGYEYACVSVEAVRALTAEPKYPDAYVSEDADHEFVVGDAVNSRRRAGRSHAVGRKRRLPERLCPEKISQNKWGRWIPSGIKKAASSSPLVWTAALGPRGIGPRIPRCGRCGGPRSI